MNGVETGGRRKGEVAGGVRGLVRGACHHFFIFYFSDHPEQNKAIIPYVLAGERGPVYSSDWHHNT